MYPSSALLGQKKDDSIVALPVDELIEKADGFAGVFPGIFTFFHFHLENCLEKTSPSHGQKLKHTQSCSATVETA